MNEHIVSFDPKFNGLGGGVVCQLSWTALKSAMESAFAVKPNEKLLGLKVSQDGISAYFEYKKIAFMELPANLPLPKRVRDQRAAAKAPVKKTAKRKTKRGKK